MDHRAARRERRDPAMSFSAGCFRVGVCFSFVLQAELFISVLCRERNDLPWYLIVYDTYLRYSLRL
jgi:hypothetical protein